MKFTSVLLVALATLQLAAANSATAQRRSNAGDSRAPAVGMAGAPVLSASADIPPPFSCDRCVACILVRAFHLCPIAARRPAARRRSPELQPPHVPCHPLPPPLRLPGQLPPPAMSLMAVAVGNLSVCMPTLLWPGD